MEDKAVWDELRQRTGVSAPEQMLIDDTDYPHLRIVEDDIAHTSKMLAIIGNAVPE